MRELEILQDILEYRTNSQIKYNSRIIQVKNPEARQVFTQLRDDEMRSVVKLQQKIEKMSEQPFIVSKIFSSKTRF
jgi:rubrerythrin